MTIGLDTSVVLRLILGEPVVQAQVAQRFLADLIRGGGRALVSDLVIAEAYFALQFHYGVSKADALKGLFRMLLSKTVHPTGRAGAVLMESGLATAKPGFVDRLIHSAYLQDGGTMATFEKAAAHLPGALVLK